MAAALQPRDAQPAPSSVREDAISSHLSGSLQSSDANSVHYHMNGLVATQTQSLQGGEGEPNPDSSQKENNPTSWDANLQPLLSNPLPRSRSPTRAESEQSRAIEPAESLSSALCTSKPAKREKPCPKDPLVPVPSVQPSANGAKTTRLSTNPSPPTARSMAPPPRPVSPYIASQDSFAGPISQPDPASAFRSRAKNFTIPGHLIGEDTQSTSDEEGPPPVPSLEWAAGQEDPPCHASPAGKILVASTPSDTSRGSQSQSQHVRSRSQQSESQDEYQYSDPYPPAQPRTHDIDMSDDDLAAVVSAAGDAAGLSMSQNTELADDTPSTQFPDDTPPTQVIGRSNENSDEPPDSRSSKRELQLDEKTRRLLSMVDPEKWHRYQNIKADRPLPSYFQPRGAAEYDLGERLTQPSDTSDDLTDLGSTQPTQPAMIEQTQPSDVAVYGSTAPPTFQRRGLPPANHALQARGLRPSEPISLCDDIHSASGLEMGTQPTQIVPEEAMPETQETEFVPDSEEVREQMRATQAKPSRPLLNTLEATSSVATYHSPDVPRPSRQFLQSEDEVLRTITTAELSALTVIEEDEETEALTDEAQEEAAAEEEEEEEEDVPLVVVTSAKRKGKAKATTPSAKSTTPTSPSAAKSGKSQPLRGPAILQRNSSWRCAVVPSSDPLEPRDDAPDTTAKPAPKKPAKPRTPVHRAPPPPPATRSAPRAAKLAARGRYQESSDEEDQAPDVDSDDGDTVPADHDDEMDVDPPDVKPKLARGNKRKRTVSSSAKKAPTKATTSKVIKEEQSTPHGRPSKRFKTASSSRMGSSGEPTRVFAFWKGTACYYSGVVHSIISPGVFAIHFDDGLRGEVELKHLRACRLKEGDEVFIGKRKGRIAEPPPPTDTGYRPQDKLTIDMGDNVVHEDEVQGIQIASKTVAVEWGDRVLSEDMIVPVIRPKHSRVSPTPSRLSTSGEGSAHGATRRVLAKTGLVLTLSPKTSSSETEKDRLMAEIRRHGGVVLDDWGSLFAMEGSLENKGQRWILTQKDIKWTKRTDIERVFLVSDDSHQKPRFLIALGLGVPCISVDWLRDTVDKVCTYPQACRRDIEKY